jgi:hypothetical protein
MALFMKHVVMVAIVACVASLIGLALFWLTGSRRTAAVVASVTCSVAVLLGSRRISSAPTAACDRARPVG